jgi:hypothetical protein
MAGSVIHALYLGPRVPGLNTVVPTLLLFGLALTLLVSCGGSDSRAACQRVRGDLEDAISYWSCASAGDADALRERHDFAECRLIEGMDAGVDTSDRAYECRRA